MDFAELDRLDHGDRIAQGVAVLRDAVDPSALFAALEAGDAGQRRLAILGAAARRDGPRLLAGLWDPSRLVRRTAAGYAARFVPAADVLAVLDALDPTTRLYVQRMAVRRGVQGLLPGLLAQAQARGDRRAVYALMRGVGAATMRGALADLDVHAVAWGRVALRQPDLALAVLSEGLEGLAPMARHRWWNKATLWQTLAELRPVATLDLLARYSEADAIPKAFTAAASRLARRLPEATADYLLVASRAAALAEQGLPAGLLVSLRLFGDARIHTLARRLVHQPTHLTALLAALAPAARPAAFAAAIRGHDVSARRWPEALVAVLPVAVRQREADRLCGLQAVIDAPQVWLAWTAFRAYADALPQLEVERRSSRAEERATGWTLRIACAGRDGDHGALVETCGALKILENEQDPVRLAAWMALAALPISRFEPAHIPALEALVGHTLAARDTSYGTRAAIQRLALALLKRDAHTPQSLVFQFALDTLGRLAGQTLHIPFVPLWPNLPRGAEHALCAVILPWAKAASARDYAHNVLSLGRALRHRAWAVPALQAVLKDQALNAKAATAGGAITLWLADPSTRDGRVRRLLDRDGSVITQTAVFDHVHRRRTSWLDPFLKGERLKGRFVSGRTAWMPSVETGFDRWSSAQQRAMVALVQRAFGHPQQTQFVRASLVRQLAALPVVQLADLEPYLSHAEVPILEAALGTVIWLDVPAPALPVLLEHLSTSRARVAMYALPRLLKLVNRETAMGTLRALLERPKLKVTVHKEALRLLGALGGDTAFELLCAAAQRPDGQPLHRDVHIALLHAARTFLDRPAAWALLEAARHGDQSVALSLLDPVPASVLPRHRARYLRLLLQLADHAEGAVRKALFLKLAYHQPGAGDWAGTDPAAVARVAADRLARDDERTAVGPAARALAAVAYHAQALAPLEALVVALRAAAEGERLAPTEVDDQPGLRRLQAVVLPLLDQRRREAWVPARAQVASVLEPLCALWPEVVGLRSASVDWASASAVVGAFAPLAGGGDASVLLTQSLAQWPQRWTASALGETAEALAAHGHPSLRRLAVGVVEKVGASVHWSAPWVARLVALRGDTSPQVAAAARRVRIARG
jgi:hypothetical protein